VAARVDRFALLARRCENGVVVFFFFFFFLLFVFFLFFFFSSSSCSCSCSPRPRPPIPSPSWTTHPNRRVCTGYDGLIRAHLGGDHTVFLDCLRGGGHRYAGQRRPLVALVPCRSDDDRRCWDEALLQHFHLYGVGLGNVPRGVYKGTVFVRWLTNRLLLVGAYSPFLKEAGPAAWLTSSQQGSRMTLSGKQFRIEPGQAPRLV
jgi:hypothetical protein